MSRRDADQGIPSYLPSHLREQAKRQMSGMDRVEHPKRLGQKKRMNATEERYAQHLDLLKRAGEIESWSFGTHRLEVGVGAWYKPDFHVVRWVTVEAFNDDETGKDVSYTVHEFHEVKGFERQAPMVRFKAAAKQYPEYRWVLVKWEGGWITEEFGEDR